MARFVAGDCRRSLPVVLAAISIALAVGRLPAQAQTSGSPEPPPRIANHYNHKSYQPTEADVCGAEKSAETCAAQARKDQDKLDSVQRQLDELQKKYPPGALSK